MAKLGANKNYSKKLINEIVYLKNMSNDPKDNLLKDIDDSQMPKKF